MAWLSNDWAYRRGIVIDNTSNSNDLTDYQVKITLDNTNFDFSHANSDGSDIRFTDDDGSTLLYHWIEKWDSTNQEAIIWVKVPSIPASSNKTIYMYYGNASASDASDVSNTFIREIDGLVGSWHFDEGSGTTAYDSSGNSNDGAINGATWVDGKFKKALSFDGSDDYVNCGNDASLDITGSITVEARVKVNSTGLSGYRRILSKREGSESCGYILTVNDGTPKFIIGNGSSNVSAVSNIDLETDKWYHILGFWDGIDTIKILVDRIERGSNTVTSLASSSHSVYIGSDTDGNYCFDGIIDEVRIYNKALSSEEISDLYNNYGYTTENYPSKVLVCKYADPEPTISIGTEQAGFCISGQVTLNGNPVQEAKVRAICQDDNSYAGDTTTDANGNYKIEGVVGSKKYHIVVEYTDGSGNKYNAESKWDITPYQQVS